MDTEFDHHNLFTNLKCISMLEFQKAIEGTKELYLSITIKQAPIYSKMVEEMLQITKIQHVPH